jgi:hypothetical protein
VPLLYLALILWLQPAGHLGTSEIAPWLGRLIYDDYDPAAYALRGLNATLGRTAGLTEEPKWLSEEAFCEALDYPPPTDTHEARYFLEYPHAALLLFRLGYVFGDSLQGVEVPAAVRDGRYHNLVGHWPRNDAERELWRRLRRALQVYTLIGTLCLLALMVVVHQGYEPGGRSSGPLVLLILPATLYFALLRFDIVPALLTASSLACVGRRWFLASAVLLGAASMVKVYPVLLAPLVARYLSAHRRTMLIWCAVYGATVLGFLLPPLLLSGWTATWGPYRYQLGREWDGWTLYGHVLPPFLGTKHWAASLFRLGTLVLAVLGLAWHRPENLTGLLQRGAIIVILFVSVQVFYSPQWILWFSPFLVPLARLHRPIFQLVIALDFVTFLTFPVVYDLPDITINWYLVQMLIYTRIVILALLVWNLWPAPRCGTAGVKVANP